MGQLTDPYKDAEDDGLDITLSGLPGEPEQPPADDDIDVDLDALADEEEDGGEADTDAAVAGADIVTGRKRGRRGDEDDGEADSEAESDSDSDADEGDDDRDEDEDEEATGEVAYDLSEWDDDQLQALIEALKAAGVAHDWDEEEDELYVREVDEGLVDAIIDDVEHPHALPEESDDGDAGGVLLGELFVLADRLQHDPEEHEAVARLLRLATSVEDAEAPYGLGDEDWDALRGRVDTLAEALEVDDPDGDEVIEAAVQLRGAIRPYV